jgi:tetratricopeptide (TPR) repeat protein
MKRLILPGIPFVLSMGLSLSTAGSHLYWQDSGFFLVAVKELGVLYPPGFVLYVLLCKLWTLAFWFLDFTYAVHLFSATCAALAAGTIAVAARDLLRTKGPLFHNAEEAGPLAEWVGAGIGCLAASGYTFWAAAILAKVYAFYYLILCLLIWRMIRADESGKSRDFTGVAVLIGLAWQAHPSATNAGLALILFVAFHRNAVGVKGLAWRVGLAALCAMGPVHLLPFLSKAGSSLRFDQYNGSSGFFDYVLGSRFTDRSGSFGWEGTRLASVARYGWEEFLGVGVVLVLAGFWRLWRENRRLLLGVLAWVLPVLAITVSFRLEGQHDFWMVAAWIPLWLVAAVGLSLVGKAREGAVVLALIGTVWAGFANRKDLDQRDYTLTETFGKYFMDRAVHGSGILLESDDAQAALLYLQRIRGLRLDLTLRSGIIESHPPSQGPCLFYYERPPYDVIQSALSSGENIAPAGAMTRDPLQPKEKADPAMWNEPIPAEDVPKLYRRSRGQSFDIDGSPHPEPYEIRLLRTLLLARQYHAIMLSREGNYREAARLYESILTLQPSLRDDVDYLYDLAVVDVGLGRYPEAEATFKRILNLPRAYRHEYMAYYFLTGLCGNRPEAAEWRAKALKHPNLPMELRLKLSGN